ncbi:unnamed protein product [Scytosiphon promiscuus]
MLDDIQHPSVMHKCLHDYNNFVVQSVRSISCAICDRNCRAIDISHIVPKDLPNKHLLQADDRLLNCQGVRGLFFNFPGDDGESKMLDGLVLERIGFETMPPHQMRACKDCLTSLKKGNMPEAALANGLWLGDFPEHLRSASFVEMIAASPVRISGMVLALDELRIRNISGTAKSHMRGTFTFYMQDAYGVQLRLPAYDTDIAGSFTCAIVGSKPTLAQLSRLLGARRKMVEDLLAYQLDERNLLVGVHALARQAQMSPENLSTYHEDGSIPDAIGKAMISVKDPTRAYANARSTHAHGNREPDFPADGDDPKCSGDGAVHADEDLPATPFIIETGAVMDTGEDRAVSGPTKPGRLRTLGATMNRQSAQHSNAEQAAADAAAAAGRVSPLGTDRALVLTRSGRMVSDFTNDGLFVGAYFDLFPHGVGGHLDKRKRHLSLRKWAQILLQRRDGRFRKNRTFLYCVCALIFRREAITNARWKLTGRISKGIALTLGSVTPVDLAHVASEMEGGSSGFSAMNARPGVRSLIKTMESVHAGSSWTIYNKRSTRMIAISFIIQMGQPLIWMTINPVDHNSPIVMKLAGVDLDVTSKLKEGFPDYAEKLRLVSNDSVASAEFFHTTIQAVLMCLLRFRASDGDGGVLGRIKGYVGMSEEQKRLTLHCHLLGWICGYNDFVSFRDLMDKTPARYTELAQYLDKIVCNQIATIADISGIMQGHTLNPTTCTSDADPVPQRDIAVRDAKDCLAVPPPLQCFPSAGRQEAKTTTIHILV